MAPKSRGCFGADWHLFKGDDHSNMIKYKTIAEAETARGDANAEEIAVLRDLMTKLQGGEAGSLVADSELRVKNSELTAKLDEQEEAIKKLKEALTVASTAIESEEAAKLAARVTALAAMDDLKMQNETLKAVAIPMTQEQSAAEARKKVEAMLARQGLLFDGAGNKNTQNSPLGVPQSWKLESLDVKKKGSNAKTMELLYDILKQYPDLYVQCHGETDADASKPADAVLAKFFGFNMMQPIQDCLAENRATAVRDALVSHGIPAERVVVTFKGCGGQSKVDIIPMPAAEALHKMRGKLMRQHTVDLQKISQVDTLEVQPTQAKDNLAAELAAEQAKSKTAASAQKEVDTAVLNAKQAELDAEKAESALELDAEKAKSASLEEALGGLFLATKAELQASAAATAVAVAATASATAVAKADLDAKKAKAVSVEEAALQLDAEKAAADLSSQAHGVLRVQVLSAAGLLAGDANGLSDPFAKIFLGAQPEVVRKTHVQKKTLNPEWGEQFDFHGTLAEMVSAPLEVQLSDSDLGGLTKTALGRVSLPFDKEVINGKLIEGAIRDLTAITGQKPSVTKARKSIAQFKLREGMPIGTHVTLRGDRMWEFLDRLLTLALPRIRDFRGLSPKQFDGRGNYTFGLTEQVMFHEIDQDKIDRSRGMDITVVTTATNDDEGRALLKLLGFPYAEK